MGKIDQNKVMQHLVNKWGEKKKCPMCNQSSWWISDTVYEMREFHGGGLVLGAGPIIPIITVACQNCGNTIFINAIVAGVVEPAKEKKEGEK